MERANRVTGLNERRQNDRDRQKDSVHSGALRLRKPEPPVRTQAICKYERTKGYPEKRVAKEHIQEELADVEIMVRQLKELLGKERVEKEIRRKVDRQIERIKKEKDTESTC